MDMDSSKYYENFIYMEMMKTMKKVRKKIITPFFVRCRENKLMKFLYKS
jgi:hypothetical protein